MIYDTTLRMPAVVDIPTQAFESKATYSPCFKHRYTLHRKYKTGKRGMLNFIMLNPSTATEHYNDPTIHRCEQRALAWGFEELMITNLFSYRATNPRDMMAYGPDATGGEKNASAILDIIEKAAMIICAWGSHGKHLSRADIVLAAMQSSKPKIHCLRRGKDGSPSHPLYLPYGLEPFLLF